MVLTFNLSFFSSLIVAGCIHNYQGLITRPWLNLDRKIQWRLRGYHSLLGGSGCWNLTREMGTVRRILTGIIDFRVILDIHSHIWRLFLKDKLISLFQINILAKMSIFIWMPNINSHRSNCWRWSLFLMLGENG